MISLNSYYHEILTTFNFSITGYDSIEKKLNDFFESFSSSTSILGEKHIDFVSFAYSKLIQIDNWKLESIHKDEFFFNTFNEKSSELLMTHDYYAFKHYLSNIETNFPTAPLSEEENKIVSGLKTSELAAALFIKPTPYRIFLGDKNYTIVRYDQHIDVLTFEIPFAEIFNLEKVQDIKTARSALYNEYEKELLKNISKRINLLFNKDKNIYKKTEEENPKSFSEDLEILDKVKITRLISLLTNKLIELNRTKGREGFFKQEISDKNGRYLEGFAKLILSHAYLSLLFDTWIENIPSVVNIDEYKNEKCLGAFIIGYKSNQEITDDERAVFRITADRISSNLAVETINSIYPELKFNRLRRKQISILQKFKQDVLSKHNIDHGINDINAESISLMNTFFTETSREDLQSCGLINFEDYVRETLIKGSKTNCGFFTEFHKPDDAIKDKNLVYDKANGNSMQINVEGVTNDNFSNRPIVNLVFPHFLIRVLEETKNTNGEPYVKNIETLTNQNKLIIKLSFNNAISIKSFSDSLTDQRTQGAGDLGQFLKSNYDAIRTIGNLIICEIEGGELKPLLNFEKDIVADYSTKGIDKLKLKVDLQDKSLTEIAYQLYYKSI